MICLTKWRQNLAILTPSDRKDAVVPQRTDNIAIFCKAGGRCADFRSGNCWVAANAIPDKGHYITKICYLVKIMICQHLCYVSTVFMLSTYLSRTPKGSLPLSPVFSSSSPFTCRPCQPGSNSRMVGRKYPYLGSRACILHKVINPYRNWAAAVVCYSVD